MTCADMSAEGYVYNPPSENKGLVLRVALGCSHNACTFCGMYQNVAFRIRPFDELLPLIVDAKEMTPNLRKVFLKMEMRLPRQRPNCCRCCGV